MGGVTYIVFYGFYWHTRKFMAASWMRESLESQEAIESWKARKLNERKKAVVLSTVLYYEWMPI